MSTTNILDLNNRIDELEKNSGGGGSADSAKRSDIATEFSTETNYTAGNFVYYEGKLYQFNADHSAGAWDPTDVVESNVTDQIVSNASAIAGLTASDVAYDNTDSGLTATDVQGAVDEVAAEAMADTGWLQIGTNDTYYRKIGKIVYVRTITPSAVAGSWTTIDILPVGYRPASVINLCLYTAASLTANIKVYDTGEIKYVCNVQDASIPIYINFIADN